MAGKAAEYSAYCERNILPSENLDYEGKALREVGEYLANIFLKNSDRWCNPKLWFHIHLPSVHSHRQRGCLLDLNFSALATIRPATS